MAASLRQVQLQQAMSSGKVSPGKGKSASHQWCHHVPEAGHVQASSWRKIENGCCSHWHSGSKTGDLKKIILNLTLFFFELELCLFPLQRRPKATAGTDIVKKSIQSLTSGTAIERVALVDSFGYDAFPALATLETLGFNHSGTNETMYLKSSLDF